VSGALGPPELVGVGAGGIGVAGSSSLVSEHPVADGEWVVVGLAEVEVGGVAAEAVGEVVSP